MANERFTGNIEGVDLSDLMGGTPPPRSTSTPQPQPAPPPAPSEQPPAQGGNPFENGNNNRRHRGWGKWVIAIVAVAAIMFVMVKWGVPFVQQHLNNPASNPNPNPSQSAQEPSGAQTPAPSGSAQPNESDNPNGGQTATLSVAEQAALLDAWYKDVPESSWVTKTAAELGATTTTPLGQFCARFCVVLADGTVITRGTSETGNSTPTIIADYVVPTEWRNSAIALDNQQINLVLVISQVPTDLSQPITGGIWQWSPAANDGKGAYEFWTNGSSSLRAE